MGFGILYCRCLCFKSSEMLHSDVLLIISDFTKNLSVLFFIVKQSLCTDLGKVILLVFANRAVLMALMFTLTMQ